MSRPRKYWLWVTHPEYAEAIEQDSTVTDGWWTAHPDTRQGDLILVYVTKPERAIHYLCEASGDAYPAEWEGPASVCEYVCHIRFALPLALPTMRDDPLLADEFSAMRGRFQQRVFEIGPPVWHRLTELLTKANPDTSRTIRALTRARASEGVLRESHIEEALADRLGVLRPTWRLRLERRQFVCGGLGRIDLLCRDRRGPVVIEVKRGKANGPVAAQTAAYMTWIRERHAVPGDRVRGLVVAAGKDSRFEHAHRAVADLHYLDLREIETALGLTP